MGLAQPQAPPSLDDAAQQAQLARRCMHHQTQEVACGQLRIEIEAYLIRTPASYVFHVAKSISAGDLDLGRLAGP